MIPPGLAPPPTPIGDRTAVAAELSTLVGNVTFDVAARRAEAEVAVTFTVGADGHPAFDLRQSFGRLVLDGQRVAGSSLLRTDLGGGPGSELWVLAEPVTAGSVHRMELAYELGLPAAEEALPIGWGDGTVAFDVWNSDLYPGRYLEQWLPVSLCQDRFALELSVAVTGVSEAHDLVANGQARRRADHRWQVRWPDHHTSLSSLLVIAPRSQLTAASLAGPLRVDVVADSRAGVEPAAAAERIAAWLAADAARLGPYVHGDRFLAHLWTSPRGMEYDGAASASDHALEHEVFHSWFGRGVKPATAADGWMDEAITTWATREEGRLGAAALGLDEPPVVLCPPSPWCRHTPKEAYTTGARLVADLTWRAGGADPVLDALAGVYAARAGGSLSTAGLEAALSEALGLDLRPWWDRYVRGLAPRA